MATSPKDKRSKASKGSTEQVKVMNGGKAEQAKAWAIKHYPRFALQNWVVLGACWGAVGSTAHGQADSILIYASLVPSTGLVYLFSRYGKDVGSTVVSMGVYLAVNGPDGEKWYITMALAATIVLVQAVRLGRRLYNRYLDDVATRTRALLDAQSEGD